MACVGWPLQASLITRAMVYDCGARPAERFGFGARSETSACFALLPRGETVLPGGVRGLPDGVRAPQTARRRCQHGPIAAEMTAPHSASLSQKLTSFPRAPSPLARSHRSAPRRTAYVRDRPFLQPRQPAPKFRSTLDARRETPSPRARRRIADERIDHYKAPRQPAEAWAAPFAGGCSS